MTDDTKITLRTIAENHGKSIASLLEEIGRNQWSQRKCLKFIKKLECLTVVRNSNHGPRLMRHNINAFKKPEYVALSYTWDNSDHEDPTHGKYMVQNRDKLQYFESPVRDCVFDRVFSFMHAKDLKRLWIDRHCVKQRTCRRKDACPHKRCNEKKSAVETMDLVYSLSKHSVALLGKPIEWEYELELLAKVLKGTFMKEPDRVNHNDILQALSLLSRITTDRWWTRAWTFQESYRGKRTMTLLIRHPDRLEKCKHFFQCFSDVPNEICIGFEQFCKTSTEFCRWAAQEIQGDDMLHHTKEILQVVGKYTVLLDRSMPMTPTIITDIQKRGLTNPWDKLAIIANCCQYAITTDGQQIQESKSLSISILAMYLLNGEILSNHPGEHSISMLEKPLSQFLKDQAFQAFDAPEDEAWLTFNKRCRFVDVQLKHDGIITEGHLWKLGRIIDPAKFRFLLPESKGTPSSIARDEKRLISHLATELRRLHEITLARHLERYITYNHRSQDETLQKTTFPRAYMRQMAKVLVAAIIAGKLLRLGRIWNSRGRKHECSAIFVWGSDGTEKPENEGKFHKSNLNCQRRGGPDWDFAFTASKPLKRGSGNHGTNDLNRHVSLEVSWTSCWDQSPDDHPQLFPKRWLAGLCFFYEFPTTSVIFPWPSYFHEVFR
ncbi:hypothetical protein FHETE_11 [Fusarium heterosporum]|uniref:Heterokaryon incompatibility domain-containing protein n=1 Tax=Fusarium heterosporum TaxID=42747 RepID=A0A8H5U4K8_FUSHE|nr:hypothetical protein FHETE_11 [Fusarium heterosporum]